MTMKNGLLSHDECKVIIEALTALRYVYAEAALNPALPQTLRDMANRRHEECKTIAKDMEAWKDR